MVLLRKRNLLILGVVILLGIALITYIVLSGSSLFRHVEQVAFSASLDDPDNEEIYVMNADRTALTDLTNHPAGDRWPAWSPDGRQIAFCSDRDGQDGMYVMNADGSNPHRLTDAIKTCGNPHVTGLYWSPDNKWIATSYSPNGTSPDTPLDVYLIKTDGSQVINLTNHPAMDWGLSWSPDSQRGSFNSDRDGNLETYVVNIDGTGLTRLTNNLARDSAGSWSADGKRLLFISDRDGNLQIYAMNPDGSGQINLTKTSANEGQAVWLPNGKEIAFISDRDGQWKLYKMNADGSEQVRVTDGQENETQFWWSPDGNLFAFNSFEGQAGDPNARWTSWIMKADGTEQMALPAVIGWFSWKP